MFEDVGSTVRRNLLVWRQVFRGSTIFDPSARAGPFGDFLFVTKT